MKNPRPEANPQTPSAGNPIPQSVNPSAKDNPPEKVSGNLQEQETKESSAGPAKEKKPGIFKNLFSRKKEAFSDGSKVFTREEIEEARKKLESDLGEQLTKIKNSKPDVSSPGMPADAAETQKEDNSGKKGKKSKRQQGSESPPSSPAPEVKKAPGIGELLQQLKGSELDKILSSMKPEDSSSVIRKVSSLNFSLYDEFYSAVASEIAGFLADQHDNLVYQLSNLRKGGGDDNELGLKAMSIPLKAKLFQSSLLKTDFDKVISLINDISNGIKQQEDELQARKIKKKEEDDELAWADSTLVTGQAGNSDSPVSDPAKNNPAPANPTDNASSNSGASESSENPKIVKPKTKSPKSKKSKPKKSKPKEKPKKSSKKKK